jgi:cobalamin biosynthesis protein CobD/CbiB
MLTPSGPSWHDLAHIEVRGCLFDFVSSKPDKVNKLRRGHIDQQCRDKLITTGVESDLLTAVEKVLRRIQVPTLAQSFADGLKRPVFSFVLGGLAGGMLPADEREARQ